MRVIDLSFDDYDLFNNTAMISELPDSMGGLSNLEELDLYGLENLKHLPPSLARLSRLKRLNTMCTGIKELQLTPVQWQNLDSLHLHGPLPDLRLCQNLRDFAWCKNVVGLGPDGTPYGTDEIVNLPLSPLNKLESLRISGGALESNSFLASMTELRSLHLSCDFENFPDGFEKLDKLENINIWGAKSLTALPEYLGHMPSLKELSLTGCGVRSLPKSVRERKDMFIKLDCCPAKWPEKTR